MNKRDWEGSRIVVEHARKNFLTRLGAKNRKDSHSEGRGQRRNSMSKRRGPQPEDSCYNCGKTGHWYGP
jgi:hypothetical protein